MNYYSKMRILKHAWEFILDRDVISYPTDFSILCHIARLVTFYEGKDKGEITDFMKSVCIKGF